MKNKKIALLLILIFIITGCGFVHSNHHKYYKKENHCIRF